MKDEKETAATTCIACSIFRKEIEALKSKGIIQCRTRYMPARRRGRRHETGRVTERLIREERAAGRKVLLLCGDCHVGVEHLEQDGGVYHVPVRDCFELLVGPDRFRCHSDQRVTYLLPEWVQELTSSLHHDPVDEDELHPAFPAGRGSDRIVYLNTGLVPIPGEQINHIAIRTGVPVEVMDISLDRIFRAIMQGMRVLQEESRINTSA